jgi:hypothetical protein
MNFFLQNLFLVAQVVNKDFRLKMQRSKEKLESNDYAVGVQYMLHVRHLETHFIEPFDPEIRVLNQIGSIVFMIKLRPIFEKSDRNNEVIITLWILPKKI